MMFSGNSKYVIKRSIVSETSIDQQQLSYASQSSLILLPNETQTIYATQSYYHNQQEVKQGEALTAKILGNPEQYLSATALRWHQYLASIESIENKKQREVAAKSIETLIAGGIAFATPAMKKTAVPVKALKNFILHQNPDTEWLEWQSGIVIGQ